MRNQYFKYVFAVAVLVIGSYLPCLAAPKQTKTHNAPLAQGIVTTVKSVRTWENLDGNLPAEESCEHWMAGSYSMNVGNFAGEEGAETPKAAGRFWELAVWFKNNGSTEIKADMIPDGGTELDASLLFGRQKSAKVKAFMIPGLGVAPTSLVTSWKGGLGFKLKPGEETWIIMVFDVPTEIKEARLQVKKATPFAVKLP